MMMNTTTYLNSTFLGLGLGLGWDSPSSSTTDFTVTLSATVLFLLTFLFFFFLHFHHPSNNTSNNKPKNHHLPPGPKPWPVVGNLPELFLNKPAFRWILALAKNNDITCVRLGNAHTVIVNSPELAREFLKKHDASFASRPITMATEYSGRGFLSVMVAPWGDQWKKMRRVVASEVINPARLWWQVNVRVEEVDNLVRYIYNLCKESKPSWPTNEAVVDVRLATRYYCGNVIRRMMFNQRYFGEGAKNGGPGIKEVEHVEVAFTVLSLIYAFCVSDYMPCLRWFDLDKYKIVTY